jgi:hypothetical protein
MVYQPVNACIYCRADDVPLTKEHVIPFALNGNITLRAASCSVCAKSTSAIELDFCRMGYGIYRAETGAQSRKPAKLAKLLEKTVNLEGKRFDGSSVTVSVPIGRVPPLRGVLRFPVPGVESGLPPDAEGECRTEFPPGHDLRLRTLRLELGLAELTSTVFTIPITSVMRVLAKIAHAYAVAELGIDGFRPVLVDLIIDGPPNPVNLYHYVGEHEPSAIQAPDPLTLRRTQIGAETWAVVDISLHFNPRFPMYQVYVGVIDISDGGSIPSASTN